MARILEYILWSNCNNACKFCLQCEKNDQSTHLDESEMISSIKHVKTHILDNIDSATDVLLVGGEILLPWNEYVNRELVDLFNTCIDLIIDGKLRYLYINTNLLYTNRLLLDSLLSLFVEEHLEDHLKFTSSYDIYGRFGNIALRHILESNLLYISKNYPTINTVVNVIMTKQLYDTYVLKKMSPIVGTFDLKKFKEKFKVSFINFIPYIPSTKCKEMDLSVSEIIRILTKREAEEPGFINFLINDLDMNQNRSLFEYRKNTGLIPCTAPISQCNHNSNFKRVGNANKCFICTLKEIFK